MTPWLTKPASTPSPATEACGPISGCQFAPTKYTHALGAKGLERFEDELRALELNRPTPIDGYDSTQRLVHHNLQRLAVARRDEEAIVASHSDLSGAYRLHDLAKALVEIDAIESAISYAERGALVDGGWQAERCAQYWWELLEQRGVADEPRGMRGLRSRRRPSARWRSGIRNR